MCDLKKNIKDESKEETKPIRVKWTKEQGRRKDQGLNLKRRGVLFPRALTYSTHNPIIY